MASNSQVHFYGAIEKFDALEDGSLIVSGIASTEAVDADGEIVSADAMRKALPAYLQKGTVREMHQPLAAGVPICAHVDDDGKTHFTAKIVDVGTVNKIKAGVLKGFSIGGKAVAKLGKIITELLLRDISVVDIPCNPDCSFQIIKFEKSMDTKHKDDCDCADCMKAKKEKSMSELMTKIDTLAETVKTLAASVEAISKQAPAVPAELTKALAELTKALAELGDLKKAALESKESILNAERGQIIAKMQSDCRVAINPETGVAYKADELLKLDLPLLKFAAANGQIVPTVARATYSGTGKGGEVKKYVDAAGKPLTGSALTAAAWDDAGYDDIDKMIANSMKR